MRHHSIVSVALAICAGACFMLPPAENVPRVAADGGLPDGGAEVDGGVISCRNAAAIVFPSFDATCRSNADCAFGLHQTDCCDGQRALGLNTDQVPDFMAAEMTCEAMFPSCDCFRWPGITTDDGANVMSTSAIGVQCVGGECRTFAQTSP
jgi:hypothetical protein